MMELGRCLLTPELVWGCIFTPVPAAIQIRTKVPVLALECWCWLLDPGVASAKDWSSRLELSGFDVASAGLCRRVGSAPSGTIQEMILHPISNAAIDLRPFRRCSTICLRVGIDECWVCSPHLHPGLHCRDHRSSPGFTSLPPIRYRFRTRSCRLGRAASWVCYPSVFDDLPTPDRLTLAGIYDPRPTPLFWGGRLVHKESVPWLCGDVHDVHDGVDAVFSNVPHQSGAAHVIF
jgi:hypothetical protein